MKKFDAKMLAVMAMLVALHVVLSRFLSINAFNLKIGFAFVPIFLAAYLFGPVEAALVGALGDFVGATLFPIGAYFPGFTLTCALTGIVFGLLLHREQSLVRVILAAAINQFILGLLLNTYWIHVLYGTPFKALFAVRIVQAAVLFVVEVVVMMLLSGKAGEQMKKALHVPA